MKKFLVLYRMDMGAMKKMMETTSADERKKGMAEWGTWMKDHTKDLADMGGPVGKNTQMTPAGATEKSNDLGGYSVIQADSKEDIVKLLADNPHFKMPGATCDIAEIVQMG